MVPFINIHTHLDSNKEGVIAVQNYLLGKELSKPNSLFTAGLHPWYIKELKFESFVHEMNVLLNNSNMLGIGEAGLDKLIETPMEIQQKIFRCHIELAERFKKPLIIHCVRAYSELLQMRKALKPKITWVLHGFNRNASIAKQLLKQNIMLSFGKDLLENEVLQSVFKDISLESVFFETDDSSIQIEEIYKKASEIKNISLEDLKEIMYQNYKKIFSSNGMA